jgi:hypothetical protein
MPASATGPNRKPQMIGDSMTSAPYSVSTVSAQSRCSVSALPVTMSAQCHLEWRSSLIVLSVTVSVTGAIISRREASVEMVTHFCESGSSVPSRMPGCSRIWRRT